MVYIKKKRIILVKEKESADNCMTNEDLYVFEFCKSCGRDFGFLTDREWPRLHVQSKIIKLGRSGRWFRFGMDQGKTEERIL